MVNECLAAALRYAAMGLIPVPIEPGKKKPWLPDWPNRASTDEATIRGWWNKKPDSGVGILTGPRGGVFLLDIDPRHGGDETLDLLLIEHGAMPDTWQATTGSGGSHYVFRYPDFAVKTCAGLFPGIDIRGEGGQFVAEPTLHPETHQPYRWDGMREIEDTPIADAPEWLLAALRKASGDDQPRQPQKPVPSTIPHGEQHQALVCLAGRLREMGMNAHEIESLLQVVNRNRCEKPGPPENIAKIAKSMERYQVGERNLFTVAHRLWTLTARAEHKQREQQQRLAVSSQDGLSVFRSNKPGPTCVVDRLLYNGLTVLAGKSKSGKSWQSLQLAISVATGQEVFGERRVLRPGGVLYYSLEMGENRNADRMRKLADDDPTLQNIDFVWECLPMVAGGIEQLDLVLSKKRPSLAIIDTFLAFCSGKTDGGKRGDVMREQYGEIGILKKLADKHDTALLLVHHTRKTGPFDGGDQGVDLVAGSRGITAACDAIWILRKADDMYCLDITGRDVEEQSLAVRFDQEPVMGWKILGDAGNIRDSRDDAEVLRVLEEMRQAKSTKIATAIGSNTGRVDSVLYRLQAKGLVSKSSMGEWFANPGREFVQ